MEQIFKITGAVAGIGGLSIALITIIFRSIITDFLAKHSPKLKRDQVYQLVNRIITLTFIVSLIGIGAWVSVKWIGHPDPGSGPEELKHQALSTLRPLLADLASESVVLVHFSDMSDESIEAELGGKSGWTGQTIKRLNYLKDLVTTLTSKEGFSQLPDSVRKVFTASNTRLEDYKDRPILRRGPIRQQASALVFNAVFGLAFIGLEIPAGPVNAEKRLDVLINFSREQELDPAIGAHFFGERKRLRE